MEFDIRIIVWIQETLGLGSKPFFDFFSELGAETPRMIIIALAFWLGGSTLGMRLALVATLGGYFNDLLKVLIAQPRPYFVSKEVQVWNDSDAFGMPSGHATLSVTLWGTLAYYLKRPIVYVLGILLIFLIGLSRIYYGSHSPSQVLMGWILGILFVVAFVKFERPFLNWFKRFRVWSQIGLVIVVTTLLLSVRVTIVPAIERSFEVPSQWNARYAAAQQFEDELNGETIEPGSEYDELSELFEKPDFETIGLFLGLSLCGIYFLAVGGFEFKTHQQKIMNVVIGAIAFAGLIPVIGFLEKDAIGSFTLGVVTPFVLAIVVPTLTTQLLKRLPVSTSATE